MEENISWNSKVKKILKGSLDLISSPSVKIQIMSGKFDWGVQAKHCWALSTNLLYSKVCWQHPAIFCLYTLPAHGHNLNFYWRWRWWDQIQAIFLNLFYFIYCMQLGTRTIIVPTRLRCLNSLQNKNETNLSLLKECRINPNMLELFFPLILNTFP